MRDKRQDIAAAADRLFYREGFAEVGIDRVVDEAAVALGTLYRHFKGRSEVVVGAMEHRHAAFLAALEQATGGRGGPDCVLGLFDALGAWSTEKGGNGCFFLRAVSDHPQDAAMRTAALAHKKAYLALVRRRLRDGGWNEAQATRLAPALFLLLEGAVAAAFTLGDEAAITEAREIAALLLRADRPKS
ncbi:TetR/AcrR family transcriptional regulator [Rhodospirillaceae bacterium SYSU D60014]|uniref:TetR/AcrR family transcriptional regulator n=1 Tax=Virgifigura deserti TaxID=2268457 RepID=UPI000E673D0B